MFKIVVDTNTVPASPTLYADIEKTQALPRVIELVQGFRGKVRVYFVGEHVPSETASLGLYVRPMNVKEKAFQTEEAAREIDESGNVYFDVNLEADTAALSVAVGASENVVMRAGLVSTDSIDGRDTQIEWQINLAVSASAIGYGANPPVSPTAIERHNADETAHPYLLERIRTLDNSASEVRDSLIEIETELSELEEIVTANKSELKTEISEVASELSALEGTVTSNYSEVKTELSEVNSEVDVIKSAYVTKGTAQEITGKKTFASSPTSMQTFWGRASALKLKNCATPFVTITGEGSDNSEFSIRFQNKNGTLALSCELDSTASEIRSELSELETELSENYSEVKTEVSELGATVASNYSELKTEISEVNSEVGVIKSNYVTTNTNQTITGVKTFCVLNSRDIVSNAFSSRTEILLYPCDGRSTVTIRNKDGALALTCEIPDISNVARLNCGTYQAPQVFTGINRFDYIRANSIVLNTTGIQFECAKAEIWVQYNTVKIPFKSGTIALTSDIPDTSGFATLAGNNTFTGSNTFTGANTFTKYSRFRVGASFSSVDFIGEGVFFLCDSNYQIRFPKSDGTLALKSDIPDTSGFAKLAVDNTFMGKNTFSGGVSVECIFEISASDPVITARGKSFRFPNKNGTFALTSDIPNTSNLSAICKTTVSNYGTITPTAGTLYFLTNS